MFRRSFVAVAAVVCAVCASSCGGDKSADSGAATSEESSTISRSAGFGGPFASRLFEWCDSVVIDDCHAICDIDVEYPVQGPRAVVDSVRIWIADELATPYLYEDLHNGQTIISEVGRNAISDARARFEQAEDSHQSHALNYLYRWNIRNAVQQADYVTYMLTENVDAGNTKEAKHYGRTFTIPEGETMGYNMFRPDMLERVQTNVARELVAKYGNRLSTRSYKSIPMPKYPPCFVDDGVLFIYQEHELGGSAEGPLQVTIPFRRLSDLMVPQARRMAGIM